MLTAYFKDPLTLIRYRQGPVALELEAFITLVGARQYANNGDLSAGRSDREDRSD